MTSALPTAIVYDTETTGLPLWNKPSDDPGQPHVVEIAAIVANREGEINRWSAIIKPDGWTISDDVAKIHGITTEKALAEGRDAGVVFAEFAGMWAACDFRVAHSESFDARMVRIAFKRHRPADADLWKAGKAFCTADLSTNICKLPATDNMRAAGRGHQFKKPKLSEAYRFFFNEDFADAHRAMPDAVACLKIYREIWRLSHQNS